MLPSAQTCQKVDLFVPDGGYLLHTVICPNPATYSDIFQCYIAYSSNPLGTESTVVFDGYETSSTKSAEQRCRAMKCTSTDMFYENMQKTTTEAAFWPQLQ